MSGTGRSGPLPSGMLQSVTYGGTNRVFDLGIHRGQASMSGMNNRLNVAENQGMISISGMNQYLEVQHNNGTINVSGMNNQVKVITYGRNGRINRSGMNIFVNEGTFREVAQPVDGPRGAQQSHQAAPAQNAGDRPVTPSKPLSSRPACTITEHWRTPGRT